MGSCSVDVLDFISAIHFEPGTLFEVRIPKVHGSTYAGYFSCPKLATEAIARFDKMYQPSGIYISLNPVSPGIKKRFDTKTKEHFEVDIKATGKIEKCGRGTQMGNDDAARRNWLFVDIDPEREAGTSSTEEQMDSSITLADRIREDLTGSGWPEPIRAMSGNGAYLLFRTDEPNNPESDSLFENCLYALIEKYSPHVLGSEKTMNTVGVDKSVHNASRICKAIGTFARKGVESLDRPHRQSWFIQESDVKPVPTELLKALAGSRSKPSVAKKTKTVKGIPELNIDSGLLSVSDPIIAEAIAEDIEKLKKIPLRYFNDRATWLAIGHALNYTHPSLLGEWVKYSKTSSSYVHGECEDIWSTMDRSKGITRDTLNQYVPREITIANNIKKRLVYLSDIENEGASTLCFEDCKLFNSAQDVSMSEGRLFEMYRHLRNREIGRRMRKGYSVGDEAISEIDSNEEIEIPPEVVEAIDSTAKVPDKVTSIDVLPKEVQDKELKKMFKQSSMIATSMLPPDIEVIVAKWQLVIKDENPPVFVLNHIDLDNNEPMVVELLCEQFTNFTTANNAILKSNMTRLPGKFAKHWGNVVKFLTDRRIVEDGDKDRDRDAAIARHVVDSCKQSTTQIDSPRFSTLVHLPDSNSSAIHYEGDPSGIESFWLNFDDMVVSFEKHAKHLGVSRTDLSVVLKKCEIFSKNTPRKWNLNARRYHKIDSDGFARLCDLSGVIASMTLSGGDRTAHIRDSVSESTTDGAYTLTGVTDASFEVEKF